MELDFRIWNGFRMIHGEELRLLTEEMFIKIGNFYENKDVIEKYNLSIE